MNENYSFVEGEGIGLQNFNLCIGAHEDSSNTYISGTATFIAKNLAITAKHVLVDIFERYNPRVKIEFPGQGKAKSYNDKITSVVLIQFFDKHQEGGIWGLKNAFLSSDTDIG